MLYPVQAVYWHCCVADAVHEPAFSHEPLVTTVLQTVAEATVYAGPEEGPGEEGVQDAVLT